MPDPLWTVVPPFSIAIPLSILHVDFTLRLIIKSIWPPPSLGSALSARRRGRRDPLQEQEEGRGQPRGEFLLFIASILGAARERERETGNSNDDDGRHPIPKAAVNGATDGPPINLQNKTFYEAPLPVFLLPWLWPDRQPLNLRGGKRTERDINREERETEVLSRPRRMRFPTHFLPPV